MDEGYSTCFVSVRMSVSWQHNLNCTLTSAPIVTSKHDNKHQKLSMIRSFYVKGF